VKSEKKGRGGKVKIAKKKGCEEKK